MPISPDKSFPPPLPNRVHSLVKEFEKECKSDTDDMVGFEVLHSAPDYILKTNAGYEIDFERYPIEDRPNGIAIIADDEETDYEK